MSENYQSAWMERFEKATRLTGWASRLENSLKQSKPNLSLAEIFPSDLDPDAGDYSPCADRVFKAFTVLKPSAVKYLVIGKDPYSHVSGNATGLAFLIPDGCAENERESLGSL